MPNVVKSQPVQASSHDSVTTRSYALTVFSSDLLGALGSRLFFLAFQQFALDGNY